MEVKCRCHEKLCFGHHLLLSLQKLNVFLESVMSADLIEDGTVAADMTKVWSLCDGV